MRLVSALTLMLVIAASTDAETICISVHEETLPALSLNMPDPVSEPNEQCYVFEDAVMGVFFDAGHIATNAKITLGTPSLEPYSSLVLEAKEGGAAWIVSFTLSFVESSARPGIRFVQGISWKILELSPRARRVEGFMDQNSLKASKPPASLEEAKAIAVDLGKASARVALKAIGL